MGIATALVFNLAEAIGACEKGGEWLLALQILEQMTHESIEGPGHQVMFRPVR